jgi:hypothetical protein
MKAFATDFDLAFKAREIVLIEGEKLILSPEHDQSFNCLRQQKLMVERHVRTSVLQGKDYPNPHLPYYLGLKKYLQIKPRFQKFYFSGRLKY